MSEIDWAPAREALQRDLNSSPPGNRLVRWAALGLLPARARIVEGARYPAAENEYVELPIAFWKAMEKFTGSLFRDWQAGIFRAQVRLSSYRDPATTVEAHLVEFRRDKLDELAPVTARTEIAMSSSDEPASKPGGRRRLPHFEDALIAVLSRLYRGDINPQAQADIEKALSEWMVANGYDAGETAIRERARKIWREITKD